VKRGRPLKPEPADSTERSRKSRERAARERWRRRKKLLREIDAEGIAKTIRSVTPYPLKLKGSQRTPAERERAWKRAVRRMYLYGREGTE